MSRTSKEVMQAAVMGLGIPTLLLVLAIVLYLPKRPETQHTQPNQTNMTLSSQSTLPDAPTVQISVLLDGREVSMDMEAYVLGVVLAEMPASFELEALKAQAVAARTYAWKTCTDGKKHNGSVCDSSGCCQGYMSTEDYLLRGWKESYVQRVYQAVMDTRGQVLTYEGKPIRATYFSCSGGMTESAVAVWGREYPYLQSVDSPGEEETVYYSDLRTFTQEEFQEALGVTLSGSPESWFSEFTYTVGGGVDKVEIGGTEYRGTTLRALLGLRSTVFSLVVTADSITFHTRGYGHRVGMSQYGADAMAQAGNTYVQILQHYYQRTELSNIC